MHGEQFLRSEEQEQDQEQEQEKETVKTKKAPLREGPNSWTTTPANLSTLSMNDNQHTTFLKVTLFYFMLGWLPIMDPLMKSEHPSRDYLSHNKK